MRIAIAMLCMLAICISCSTYNMNPDSYMSKSEQLEFKTELCRYLEKLPLRTTLAMRWDSSALPYYHSAGKAMKLVKLYKDDKGYYYFYVTRIVPSVREGDRRAESGKCLYENGRIKDIEEFVFSVVESPKVLEEASEDILAEIIRTNKSPEGNPLVEWPNDYFYYDKKGESWDRRPSTTVK